MPEGNTISSLSLSSFLRKVLFVAGALDLLLGVIFFIAPETGMALWPSAIPALVSRFIGSIVFASGVGVLVAARQGDWHGARPLFYIGIVYSLLTLIALLYHLFFKAAPAIFWVYVALDLLYTFPIAYVIWTHER